MSISRPFSLNYAAFLQRLIAVLIDGLVLLPLVAIRLYSESTSRIMALIVMIPLVGASMAYTICSHAKYGRTLGKYVVGIRVIRTNGAAIGWNEAWRRSSVDVVFGILNTVSSLAALSTITDSEFFSNDWTMRIGVLQGYNPPFLEWTVMASAIWLLANVVAILCSSKRRALHDLIADTAVVVEPNTSNSQI